MKLIIILLLVTTLSYAKTNHPKIDQAIRSARLNYLPKHKAKEFHSEILKLHKKNPHYLPLELNFIFSLSNLNMNDEVQQVYENRWKTKMTKRNHFLYLYTTIVSWRTSPSKTAKVLKKIEEIFDKKNIKSDLNYNTRITILNLSRNLKQRKKAQGYLNKNFPQDPAFRRIAPRLLAAEGKLNELISKCTHELQNKDKELANCKRISHAQVEPSKAQISNINQLKKKVETLGEKTNQSQKDFLISMYKFISSLGDAKETEVKLGNKISSFQKSWIPSEDLRKYFEINDYKGFLLFENLYKIISTPDVKTKIEKLKGQFSQVKGYKKLTNLLYQNVVSSYLHPTIKDEKKAIKNLEQWLKFDKENYYAKKRLAEFYLKTGKKLEKALEFTNELISIQEEHSAKQQDNYPNYVEFLNQSNSNLAALHRNKGEILQKMKKYAQSIGSLKLSFSLAPKNEVANLLYQSYQELDKDRDRLEWGLIALVKTKEDLPKEATAKLKKDLKQYISQMTGASAQNIKLPQLAAKKRSLYHLGDKNKKKSKKDKKHPLIGKSFIPLPYNTINKKPFNWKSLKGKNVVLSFWATWCVPCIQELTVLDKLKRDYKGKPLEIVAVCTDGLSKKKEMKKIIKKARIKHIQILEGKSDAMDTYGFNAIPTAFYINQKGKIIDKGQGYSEHLDEEIKKNLHL